MMNPFQLALLNVSHRHLRWWEVAKEFGSQAAEALISQGYATGNGYHDYVKITLVGRRALADFEREVDHRT